MGWREDWDSLKTNQAPAQSSWRDDHARIKAEGIEQRPRMFDSLPTPTDAARVDTGITMPQDPRLEEAARRAEALPKPFDFFTAMGGNGVPTPFAGVKIPSEAARYIAPFGGGLIEQATLGAIDMPEIPGESRGARAVGEFAGMALPAEAAARGVGMGIKAVAPGLAQSVKPLVKIGRRAVEGALAGAGYGAATEGVRVAKQEPLGLSDLVTGKEQEGFSGSQVAMDAGIWGAMDATLASLGVAGRLIKNAIRNGNKRQAIATLNQALRNGAIPEETANTIRRAIETPEEMAAAVSQNVAPRSIEVPTPRLQAKGIDEAVQPLTSKQSVEYAGPSPYRNQTPEERLADLAESQAAYETPRKQAALEARLSDLSTPNPQTQRFGTANVSGTPQQTAFPSRMSTATTEPKMQVRLGDKDVINPRQVPTSTEVSSQPPVASVQPSTKVYHGTTEEAATSISQQGLTRGMFADTYEQAYESAVRTANRSGGKPVVLQVDAITGELGEPIPLESITGKSRGNYFDKATDAAIPPSRIKRVDAPPSPVGAQPVASVQGGEGRSLAFSNPNAKFLTKDELLDAQRTVENRTKAQNAWMDEPISKQSLNNYIIPLEDGGARNIKGFDIVVPGYENARFYVGYLDEGNKYPVVFERTSGKMIVENIGMSSTPKEIGEFVSEYLRFQRVKPDVFNISKPTPPSPVGKAKEPWEMVKELGPLVEEARKYKSASEFRSAFTQSNLVDLSDYHKHRWGRAIPPYKSEASVASVSDILKDNSGYLEDIRLSNPRTYYAMRSPGKTVRVYRAVPPTNEQLIDFYGAEMKKVLRLGSRGKYPHMEQLNFKNTSQYFDYLSEEVGKLRSGGEAGVASNKLAIGDYVALDPSYAKMHGESVIVGEQKYPTYKMISKTVSKDDVIWGEADWNEWAYSPKQVRDAARSLEDLWERVNGLAPDLASKYSKGGKGKAKEGGTKAYSMVGGAAGIEPTDDENADIKTPFGNVNINPTKAAIGLGLGAVAIHFGGKFAKGNKEFSPTTATGRPEPKVTKVERTPVEPVVERNIPKEIVTGEVRTGLYRGINLSKLNIDEAAKQSLAGNLDEMKAVLEKARGGVITHEQVIEAAQFVKAAKGTISPSQALMLQAEDLAARQELAAQIVNRKSKEVTDDILDAVETVATHGSTAARILGSRRIMADALMKSIDDNLQYKVLAKLTTLGIDRNLIKDVFKGVDWKNTKDVINRYRKLQPASVGEILSTYRYGNMLSSPMTHIRNLASNVTMTGLVTPVEKLVSGAVDAVGSGLTGRARTRYMSEAAPYWKAWGAATLDGAKGAWKVMKEGRLSERLDFDHLPLGSNKIIDPQFPGKVATAKRAAARSLWLWEKVGTVLEAEDVMFSTMAKAAQKESLAIRYKKMGKVVSDEALDKEAGELAETSIFRKPLDTKNISGQGDMLSYIDRGTQWILSGRKKLGPVAWYVPFVTTPMNIAKQGLEHTPGLGALTMIGNASKSDVIAKQIVGSMVFMGAGTLALNGRTTWAAPRGEKEQKAFYASGRKPYSILVPNPITGKEEWRSMAWLGPLAYPIAVAAAIKYHTEDSPTVMTDDQVQRIMKILSANAGYFSDQSYVKGMGGLLDAAEGRPGSIEQALMNPAQQLIPFGGMLGWINRSFVDPVYRDAGSGGQGMVNRLKSGIPILSKEVPPFLDPQGKPSMRPNPIQNAFDPTMPSPMNPKADSTYLQTVKDKQLDVKRDAAREKYNDLKKQGLTEEANALWQKWNAENDTPLYQPKKPPTNKYKGSSY